MPAVNEPIHAPEFHPGTWLNSTPLSLQALHGRVVLVLFWDYTSINCLRTLPYLREWWRRYHEAGLVIIGVHTPQFSFGKNPQQVERAVRDHSLDFPILLDDEQHNWHSWTNRYWPTRYLVDKDGNISYFHLGEGDYVGFEWNIQLLLRQVQASAVFPPPMQPLRPSDEPGAICCHATPELQLGHQRGQLGNAEPLHPNHTVLYTHPGKDKLDTLYLDGYWHSGPEAVTLSSGQGGLTILYRGKEVAAVLTPPEDSAGRAEVQQDGDMLSNTALGDDVRNEGNAVVLTIDTPRLYSLVNNPHFGVHTLRLLFTTPGVSLYAVSFVSECVDEERKG